jgi:hypothetical protein
MVAAHRAFRRVSGSTAPLTNPACRTRTEEAPRE